MSQVRGWCPTAHRPMLSGDGYLMRVRPPGGVLTAEAAFQLADLATGFGNGLIDVTARANLQLRGIAEADIPVVLSELVAAGLVPGDPLDEMPLTVTPFPDARGVTERLLDVLADTARQMPALPDKMGVVVDTGAACWLQQVSGDFRFETGGTAVAPSQVILRADGARCGVPVDVDRAGEALIALACWFVETGGSQAGRMRRHLATVALPGNWQKAPVSEGQTPPPLDPSAGHLGVAFGQISAVELSALVAQSAAARVTITPWRSLILKDSLGSVLNVGSLWQEAGRRTDISVRQANISEPKADISVAPGPSDPNLRKVAALGTLIGHNDDPLRRVAACPGQAGCPQASVETRDLARRLSSVGAFEPAVPDKGAMLGSSTAETSPSILLHVSGCTKGCALQKSAPMTLVGRNGAFDLVLDGRSQDEPVQQGLTVDQVQTFARGTQVGLRQVAREAAHQSAPGQQG